MKRILLTAALVLASLSPANAQSTNKKTTGDLEQHLIKLKHDIGRAYVERDAAALERLYADEYTVTDDAGVTTGKQDELARLKDAAIVYEATSYEDVKVRVYGDTAIVAGRGTVKGRGKNGAFHTRYFSTNVFVRRNGRWRAVAAHISGVTKL